MNIYIYILMPHVCVSLYTYISDSLLCPIILMLCNMIQNLDAICMYSHMCDMYIIYIHTYLDSYMVNVGKAIISHPPTFCRRYGSHSQSWVVYGIVLPTARFLPKVGALSFEGHRVETALYHRECVAWRWRWKSHWKLPGARFFF